MFSTENKTIEEKAERLAFLKMRAKWIDEEIKEIQKELLTEGVACDLFTPMGMLVYSTRENYELVDKQGVIKHLGQKVYNAHSTISKTAIEKAVGQLGFQEVLDSGFMKVKNISEYFMLKAQK